MQLHLQLDTSSKRTLFSTFPQGTRPHRHRPNTHKRPSRNSQSILQRQARRRPHWPSGRNTPTTTRVYVAMQRHARLPCRFSHFNTNSVGDARPVDAGRYWACMTLRSAFDCWADTWRRWWAMDYRDGSLRYSWVPKRRRTQTDFYFAVILVYGTSAFLGVRSVGVSGCTVSLTYACVAAR